MNSINTSHIKIGIFNFSLYINFVQSRFAFIVTLIRMLPNIRVKQLSNCSKFVTMHYSDSLSCKKREAKLYEEARHYLK